MKKILEMGEEGPSFAQFEREYSDALRKVDVAQGPRVSHEIKTFLAEEQLWKDFCESFFLRVERFADRIQSASSFLSLKSILGLSQLRSRIIRHYMFDQYRRITQHLLRIFHRTFHRHRPITQYPPSIHHHCVKIGHHCLNTTLRSLGSGRNPTDRN